MNEDRTITMRKDIVVPTDNNVCNFNTKPVRFKYM